jgi:hypothetical protein
MSLNPNDFPSIEDYLSKLKTLILLLQDYKIDMKDDQCIYIILSKLGSAYCVFVTIFCSTREALGDSYIELSLESLCDSLIRKQDNIFHLGVISIAGLIKP